MNNLLKVALVSLAIYTLHSQAEANVICHNVAAAVKALASMEMENESPRVQRKILRDMKQAISKDELDVTIYIYKRASDDALKATSMSDLEDMCFALVVGI